ncbi:MAG TPA: hypothetical protein VHV31_10750, partial [Nitrolancea sp.]|nr:hypothetical protein [Nitrolancea sp.]
MLSDRRPNFLILILMSVAAAVAQVPLGLWARHLGIGAGVVPIIDAPGRTFWFVGIVVALAFAVLFQLLSQNQPSRTRDSVTNDLHDSALANLPTAWILPLISILTATMVLAIYHSRASLLCATFGLFFVLGAGSIA